MFLSKLPRLLQPLLKRIYDVNYEFLKIDIYIKLDFDLQIIKIYFVYIFEVENQPLRLFFHPCSRSQYIWEKIISQQYRTKVIINLSPKIQNLVKLYYEVYTIQGSQSHCPTQIHVQLKYLVISPSSYSLQTKLYQSTNYNIG